MLHRTVLACLCIACVAPPACAQTTQPGDWPGFRGLSPDGSAPSAGNPPDKFVLAADVRFKVNVPGKGNSSPIVVGRRIFLTAEGGRILAFDRDTGRLLWDRTLKAPAPETMPGDDEAIEPSDDTGGASPTPCSDGKFVYAFFGDSTIGCFDLDGKQVWADRLIVGKPHNTFGLAASPVLYDGLLIQVIDQGNEPEDARSFMVALRTRDGSEAWRVDRPTRSAWTTPVIARSKQGDTLVTVATPWVIGYDPRTGRERWRAGEINGDVAACPVLCGDVAVAIAGENENMLAVRLGGRDDVTKTHVLWNSAHWKDKPRVPDVASGVCDGKQYFQFAGGELQCFDVAAGKRLWTKEVGGSAWASLVRAVDRLYILDQSGELKVLSTKDGTLRGATKLGEKTVATPAIVDGRVYIRTAGRLWCLGKR